MTIRNGPLGLLAPLTILAGGALPDALAVIDGLQRRTAESHLRAILGAFRDHAKANDGLWPRDLKSLQAWSQSLPAEVFSAPGRPDIAAPLFYHLPADASDAGRPVLIQNPASNRGAGSLVGYLDGRIEFIAGRELWDAALRPPGEAPQESF